MRPAHKAATILIVAALALSMTACGTTTQPGPRAITPVAVKTTVPVATSTVIPAGTGTAVRPTAENPLGIDWAKQAPFTGPAAHTYGAAKVMAAYREAVEFALLQGSTNLMAKGYDAKAAEFSFITPYLTPGTQKLWAGYVKTALADPKADAAAGSVSGLTNWNIAAGQDTFKFRPGQLLYTVGNTFTAAKASVEGDAADQALVLEFTVRTKIRLMKGAKAVLIPFTKKITYGMVPNELTGRPWLITRWETSTTSAAAVPDPMGATD